MPDVYLGPPGAMVALPPPLPNIEMPLQRPTAEQQFADGGVLVDRFGDGRRRYTIQWEHLTVDELAIIERLALLPGPLILDMPDRRNRLTANQSSGGDVRRTDDGVLARFQGVESVSTVQFRSAPRSFAWATGTALAATGRGLYLYNSATVVDRTWHPVRGGAFYVSAGYLRATAAVNMQAGFDWHDATGAFLSASAFGSSTAVSTANFATRVERSGVAAPAGAAYGIPFWLNANTTGAAITVYLDDPMVSEVNAAGVAAGAYVIGTGMPRVAVVETPASSRLIGYTSPTLVLQEVG
jgi:hypothetical protein